MSPVVKADKGIVLDPLVREHATGRGHPERAARFDAVRAGLEAAGLLDGVARIPTRQATVEELRRVHTAAYLQTIHEDFEAGERQLSTGDTDIGPRSLEVALRAVGGALNAVDAVMAGTLRSAFCAIRPPGHHATPGRGMGFCMFNNVALAARHAQRRHGAERVLIVDWDVHHGNGTQDVFYEDPSVFFFSSHQFPWYPGTGAAHEMGAGAGEGSTYNLPLPQGTGGGPILAALRDQVGPRMEEFRPDLILVSAGFDSRAGDPLGDLLVTDGDFAEMTTFLGELAARHCGGRLVSVLEGGYNLEGLASASAAHFGAL